MHFLDLKTDGLQKIFGSENSNQILLSVSPSRELLPSPATFS
jgi:hypothetical protein